MWCHARSRTTILATLNVHTTVTVLLNYYLLHAVTSPPYHVLEYWRTVYTNTYLRGAAVLYAEKYVQVTCEPQHCMTTISLFYPHNCFLFLFFILFFIFPFSDHTVVSTIIIFVCADDAFFVVFELVEKWHVGMKRMCFCLMGYPDVRSANCATLPCYSVLQYYLVHIAVLLPTTLLPPSNNDCPTENFT